MAEPYSGPKVGKDEEKFIILKLNFFFLQFSWNLNPKKMGSET